MTDKAAVRWADVLDLFRTANEAARLHHLFAGREDPFPARFLFLATDGLISHIGWKRQDGTHVVLHASGQVGLMLPGGNPAWN